MNKLNIAKLVAIVVALPSNILGCSYFVMLLEKKGYITSTISMLTIVAVIFINFFWIIRYAVKKSN